MHKNKYCYHSTNFHDVKLNIQRENWREFVINVSKQKRYHRPSQVAPPAMTDGGVSLCIHLQSLVWRIRLRSQFGKGALTRILRVWTETNYGHSVSGKYPNFEKIAVSYFRNLQHEQQQEIHHIWYVWIALDSYITAIGFQITCFVAEIQTK